jgi:hypothetical protein
VTKEHQLTYPHPNYSYTLETSRGDVFLKKKHKTCWELLTPWDDKKHFLHTKQGKNYVTVGVLLYEKIVEKLGLRIESSMKLNNQEYHDSRNVIYYRRPK